MILKKFEIYIVILISIIENFITTSIGKVWVVMTFSLVSMVQNIFQVYCK